MAKKIRIILLMIAHEIPITVFIICEWSPFNINIKI